MQSLKQRPQSAGKASKIVTNEYLRGITDLKLRTKVSTKNQRAHSPPAPTIARSRFDLPEPSSPELAENIKVVQKQGHTNPNTIQFVDRNKTRDEQLLEIDLPAMSLYLIDKVVRQKAAIGPIGVDNSEVINIELERELKRRNKQMYGEGDDLEGLDEAKMTEQERED